MSDILKEKLSIKSQPYSEAMSRQAPVFQRTPPLRVKYQHNSGAEEILRPTLMTVSDGRCYRKLTDETFGPRKSGTGSLSVAHHVTTGTTESTTTTSREEPVSKQPLFTGRYVLLEAH